MTPASRFPCNGTRRKLDFDVRLDEGNPIRRLYQEVLYFLSELPYSRRRKKFIRLKIPSEYFGCVDGSYYAFGMHLGH
jgi:hypothetical protein